MIYAPRPPSIVRARAPAIATPRRFRVRWRCLYCGRPARPPARASKTVVTDNGTLIDDLGNVQISETGCDCCAGTASITSSYCFRFLGISHVSGCCMSSPFNMWGRMLTSPDGFSGRINGWPTGGTTATLIASMDITWQRTRARFRSYAFTTPTNCALSPGAVPDDETRLRFTLGITVVGSTATTRTYQFSVTLRQTNTLGFSGTANVVANLVGGVPIVPVPIVVNNSTGLDCAVARRWGLGHVELTPVLDPAALPTYAGQCAPSYTATVSGANGFVTGVGTGPFNHNGSFPVPKAAGTSFLWETNVPAVNEFISINGFTSHNSRRFWQLSYSRPTVVGNAGGNYTWFAWRLPGQLCPPTHEKKWFLNLGPLTYPATTGGVSETAPARVKLAPSGGTPAAEPSDPCTLCPEFSSGCCELFAATIAGSGDANMNAGPFDVTPNGSAPEWSGTGSTGVALEIYCTDDGWEARAQRGNSLIIWINPLSAGVDACPPVTGWQVRDNNTEGNPLLTLVCDDGGI